MLFATNLNSQSITERTSAERFHYLTTRTSKERRLDIEDERRWKQELVRLARQQAKEDGEEEAERKLWHRKTK